MGIFKDEEGIAFSIETPYGETYFKNSLKFYKFQMLCTHPTSFWVRDKDERELVCERCCMVLKQFKNGKMVDYKKENKYLGSRFAD